MAKKAQPIREDHLERQETAEELRERIRVLFKLKNTPDDKTVKMLLSRLEKYKKTGLDEPIGTHGDKLKS